MINTIDGNVTIRTGGKILGGWVSVRVTRGVERLPSDFEIELTERYPADPRLTVVTPGSTCEIFLGTDQILSGYIDRYMPGYDAEGHRVRIAGRSKTEDLVDCSVDTEALGAWQITDTMIGAAAKKIAKQYNIDVVLPDGDAQIPSQAYFEVLPGYTCYLLLEEISRACGMLVWDDPQGRLVLSKGGTAGRAATAIVEGQNVEAAEVRLTMDQRFQTYVVVSQTADPDHGHYNSAATAYDPLVTRPRLKLIPAEGPYAGTYFAQLRANWTAARRRGRGQLARVTVTGWRDGAGALWTPNKIVSVSLPRLKVGRDMVIAECTWEMDAQGTRTILTLMPKEGLLPEPLTILPPVPDDGASAGAPTPQATTQPLGDAGQGAI